MIEHVYRRAAEARGIDAVVVATDDQRVASAVEGFGGIARMTGAHHRTGMDRIAEVARDLTCAIIVNVQGDEPGVEPSAIALMVDALIHDPALQMATLRTLIRHAEDYDSPHVVKVVVDANDNALYFSRAPIPYHRHDLAPKGESHAYKHLGLYAYRRDFLLRLAALPQTELEQAESLEQLRALEHGHRIRAVETQHDSIGVDTPEDLERVRSAFALARFGETEATRV
jgi:3-deoxy-manno-octulosonate cytidylyltransferase (CMP-KDO synthetase)